MNRTHRTFVAGALVALALGFAVPASAQDGGKGGRMEGPSPRRERRIERRIENEQRPPEGKRCDECGRPLRRPPALERREEIRRRAIERRGERRERIRARAGERRRGAGEDGPRPKAKRGV